VHVYIDITVYVYMCVRVVNVQKAHVYTDMHVCVSISASLLMRISSCANVHVYKLGIYVCVRACMRARTYVCVLSC
jgi:hypothetical protein